MVFSNPAVVRRVNEAFIPVALKAALINNPPGGIEGGLLAEIGRSKPAPQGISSANSDGKVLTWALSFDDDASIETFLDHVAERYRQFPDAKKPVAAERFMKFSSRRLPDIADANQAMAIPATHAVDDRCPSRPAVESGTLVGRIIGRALDGKGVPLTETTRQENYMEARHEVSVASQKKLVSAARGSKRGTFKIPREFTLEVIGPAYLGQLDVDPFGKMPGSRNDKLTFEFWGEPVDPNEGKEVRIRIEGSSTAEGAQAVGSQRRGDGALWEHRVTLKWQGYADIKDGRVIRLTMLAEGDERLRWGNDRFHFGGEPDAAHLMAGRAIDLTCGVRYGLDLQSAAADEVVKGAATGGGSQAQTARRIEGKIQRLQAGVRMRQQAGKEMAPIARLMQQFGPLMQRQKIVEAEALLDRVLSILEGEPSGASPGIGDQKK